MDSLFLPATRFVPCGNGVLYLSSTSIGSDYRGTDRVVRQDCDLRACHKSQPSLVAALAEDALAGVSTVSGYQAEALLVVCVLTRGKRLRSEKTKKRKQREAVRAKRGRDIRVINTEVIQCCRSLGGEWFVIRQATHGLCQQRGEGKERAGGRQHLVASLADGYLARLPTEVHPVRVRRILPAFSTAQGSPKEL